MKIIVARHAGFCYGVKRAFDLAVNESEKNQATVYTYGPLAHNKDVIEFLEKKDIVSNENLDYPKGTSLLIRAHGVMPSVIENANNKGFKVIDATCPFVSNIHKIVKKSLDEGNKILIIGDKKHPEIIGIAGIDPENTIILKDMDEVLQFESDEKFVCVQQTTYNEQKFLAIKSVLQKKLKKIKFYFTICSATKKRQEEVRTLAENVDFTIVLGGKNSSNTKKLYEIIRSINKKTIHIEKKSEIKIEKIQKYDTIGIVAGASTPKWSIDELVMYLQKNLNFEE